MASRNFLMPLSLLMRRLPCYWYRGDSQLQPIRDQNKSSPVGTDSVPPIIVVLDEVFICPPYRPASCRGSIKSNLALVERVKKVLEGERKRLGL